MLFVDPAAVVWLLLLLFACVSCAKAAAEADRATAEPEDYLRRKEDGGADTPDPPSLRPIQIPEEGDGDLDDMVRYVTCFHCRRIDVCTLLKSCCGRPRQEDVVFPVLLRWDC